jgi:hypothetical protein
MLSLAIQVDLTWIFGGGDVLVEGDGESKREEGS